MGGVLLPLAERAEWDKALEGIPHAFTHTWEHCHAISLSTGVAPFLWRFDLGADRVVCPLMARPFDEFRDVATPPGVAGFAGRGAGGPLRAAWERFVHRERFVAGYLGLHPLFAAEPWRSAAQAYNSLYILDLRQPAEKLLQRMDRNRRRELRSYQELLPRISTDRPALTRYLCEQYPAFADRVALPTSERWSLATLQAYCQAPATLLVGVSGPAGIVVAHLYAYTAHAAEFVLQIAAPNAREHTTGLLWHAVLLLQSQGVPLLNLGGGVKDDDAIAEAKQRLGADRHALRALREVYDPAAYAALCQRAGRDPEAPGYFPAYRAGAANGS